MKYVEIVEWYKDGKVFKRTVNGIEVEVSVDETPVMFTHRVRMSEQDFKKAYGKVIPS